MQIRRKLPSRSVLVVVIQHEYADVLAFANHGVWFMEGAKRVISVLVHGPNGVVTPVNPSVDILHGSQVHLITLDAIPWDPDLGSDYPRVIADHDGRIMGITVPETPPMISLPKLADHLQAHLASRVSSVRLLHVAERIGAHDAAPRGLRQRIVRLPLSHAR
jgi:hypothetical protein